MAANATQTAYHHVKERILDGRIVGGDLISEGEVAAAVGLSRTPVREAFLRLESEGLLRLYPRRGALVVPVSAAEIEDVIETRRLIELHAIDGIGRDAVRLGDRLAELIGDQERLAGAGDARGFVESDRELHRAIVSSTGNAILISVHDSLRDRQSRMGLAALAADAGRVQEILGEHRAIAATVRGGDAAAARTLLASHIDGTLSLLRGAPRSKPAG
jgi:DNA-binding GntR family transcriptional regulator